MCQVVRPKLTAEQSAGLELGCKDICTICKNSLGEPSLEYEAGECAAQCPCITTCSTALTTPATCAADSLSPDWPTFVPVSTHVQGITEVPTGNRNESGLKVKQGTCGCRFHLDCIERW